MRVVIVDISGKVTNYDVALVEALNASHTGEMDCVLMAPNLKERNLRFPNKPLLSLVPEKYRQSTDKFKRYVKAFEGLMNYLCVIAYCLVHRVRVLHLQWLPFLEFKAIEIPILRFFRFICPMCKVILTVHNLYPHDMSDEGKQVFKERMKKAAKEIDSFIVHTGSSKSALAEQFDIETERINVVHHGIFAPNDVKITPNVVQGKWHFILYGIQSRYKGTDIYLDALQLLPQGYKDKINSTIVGKMDGEYLATLKSKAEGLNVDWMPFFVPNEVLYQKILESNVIVIPYRQISQSGVLLLALHFKRNLLLSDLPSFRETLAGFTDDMFFENGNATSLAEVIKAYIDGNVDLNGQIRTIEKLNKKYSWEMAAEKTRVIYHKSS